MFDCTPGPLVRLAGFHSCSEGSSLPTWPSKSVQLVDAPLETQQAIGRVERHGGILKAMVTKTGQEREVLSECVSAKTSCQDTIIQGKPQSTPAIVRGLRLARPSFPGPPLRSRVVADGAEGLAASWGLGGLPQSSIASSSARPQSDEALP